jgi:glutathione-regulated potassium-efflux system protein KefB
MAAEAHNVITDVMFSGVVLLGASLLSVLLFRKLGLGAVLGYIVAGIVIGPDGFALTGDPQTILSYSEIGIILLLFLVGLELSPKRLWLLRNDIFVFGPLQVLMCGFAMFALIFWSMPFSWEAALVLGLPLGLSSTAQVLPLLQSRGRLKTDYGRRFVAGAANGHGEWLVAGALCHRRDCRIGDRRALCAHALDAANRQDF